MQRSFFKYASILLCLLSSSVFAKAIILSDVMSREDQHETGVDTLNAKQKLALQTWLDKNFVLKSDMEKEEEEKKVPASLYLSQSIDNGTKLILSDDSMYLVSPEDVTYTSFWITPFPLRLEDSGDPEYPVRIVNINNGKSVKARQIKPPRG
jgi:hypothetical protein